jgi:long-chain acyl-CoA synthetase
LWLPLTHHYARVHVVGQQNLAALEGPAIFAANHQSHLDAPVILGALPARYRQRIAVAMWKEYFDAHYVPQRHTRRERLLNSTLFWLVTLFFHAVVLPQTEAGAGQSLRHMGELVSQGWSILLFPEGERTVSGKIRPFLPGIGFMAARLQVPVVPIYLHGLDRVLHRYARWPRRGPVEISIGAPLHLTGEDYPALAAQVEQAVRGLADEGWREAA